MAHLHASAPHGRRVGPVLSADNHTADRFSIMDMLRQAAPLLGLTAPVLATLDTLLSCLPPKRTHHVVFASNHTLALRRNGVSDRTLRRHFALLQDIGLLQRHDSPNGKRFTRRDPDTDLAMRFGLDLAPMFDRLAEIADAAAEALRQEQHLRYLRMKLRAILSRVLTADPENAQALQTLRLLRRKLPADILDQLIRDLTAQANIVEGPADPAPQPAVLSATDGQNVRQGHTSEKELIDKKAAAQQEISVPVLLASCPEAAEFATNSIETTADVVRQATLLAPMMGIETNSYRAAEARMGPLPTALTVWLVLSMGNRIQRMGAYFHAVTSGPRSTGFDPWHVIQQRYKARLH